MKTFYKLIIGSFILVAFVTCSEDTISENGFGILTGTVVKKGDNTPIGDVKITTNPASTTVFTDDNGEFVITNIASGQYSVQSEKEDFLASFQAATIVDGVTSNVVFEMDISTANNRPPEEPTLLFPLEDAIGVDLVVEFSWTSTDPDDDDIIYTFNLKNSSNEEIVFAEELEDSTYIVQDLRLGETYFWQVSASDNINPPVQSVLSSFTAIDESFNRFYYVKKEGNNNVIYSGGDQGEDPNYNEFQLTSNSFNSFRPRKNNTNNKIAFLRTDGSEIHLYTMNTDGSNVAKLTSTIPVSGFRQDEIDFTWYQNGSRLYYPNLNKLYSISASGTGNTLIYEAPAGVFITEVDTNEFNNLILLKTNDADGYNARIFIIDVSGNEQEVIIEGETGALGGIDFSIDGSKVLYTRDVSGSENPFYRQLDSRIFEYDTNTDVSLEIDSDKPGGSNDLDVKYSPDNGGMLFMNTSNDGVSQKKIYRFIFDEDEISRKLLFSDSSMPDWQ